MSDKNEVYREAGRIIESDRLWAVFRFDYDDEGAHMSRCNHEFESEKEAYDFIFNIIANDNSPQYSIAVRRYNDYVIIFNAYGVLDDYIIPFTANHIQ